MSMPTHLAHALTEPLSVGDLPGPAGWSLPAESRQCGLDGPSFAVRTGLRVAVPHRQVGPQSGQAGHSGPGAGKPGRVRRLCRAKAASLAHVLAALWRYRAACSLGAVPAGDRPVLQRVIGLMATIGQVSLFVFILQYYIYFSLLYSLHLRPGHYWPLYFLISVALIIMAALFWHRRGLNRFITVGYHGKRTRLIAAPGTPRVVSRVAGLLYAYLSFWFAIDLSG